PVEATVEAVGRRPRRAKEPEAVAPEPEAEPEPVAVAAPEPEPEEEPGGRRTLKIHRGATAQEIAERTGATAAEIVKTLIMAGEMSTATQPLSDEALALVLDSLGLDGEIVEPEEEEAEEEEAEEVDESRLVGRAPVVTVMGHVDHGKSSILDAIRQTDVVSGEAGGITQHIGAYQVHQNGREITFIDTPGHEAFTAMRARGAQVTDIAILVVAADDGVKPQTLEAIDHARAAEVPIVVAVNKIDKPEADPTRVRQQLSEQGVQPEEWGGDTVFVDVSAKTKDGLEQLLEMISLVADLEDLKADPEAPARGVAIEAHLDRGRGPSATVLVSRGTLRIGDAVVAGTAHGRVRQMLDENGQAVQAAGPSKPVQVLGWSSVPQAGDEVRVVADEREARRIAQEREAKHRAAEQVAAGRPSSLAELLARAQQGEIPELPIILKADVQGSIEALTESLEKLPSDEVRVRILHRGTGQIGENDVTLAQASGAIIIGFNVRPSPAARELAEKEGVDVRLYDVIYQAVDDVRAALSGMLAPAEQEVELGRAEVRALFRVPRLGVIAGSYVQGGTIVRSGRVRVVRDGTVVHDGRIASLRRFKDDVREVAEGFECGIGLESFQDLKEGDVLEAYEVREVARSL
ncbi:MAG TPA: translation initiation factor IF-2, partial [Actinomycetota bacterium]|nr:translation initiation factor IF-2 [Actinomycetota bacterium]